MHNRKGFTLLEIIVATLILALVMTGLVNVFLAAKRHLTHTRSKIQGAELGRLFVTPLQMYVRQDTWNQSGNALNIGTRYCDNDAGHTQQPNCPSQAERTLDGIEYKAQYDITSPFAPSSDIRKVKVTINWTEPPS